LNIFIEGKSLMRSDGLAIFLCAVIHRVLPCRFAYHFPFLASSNSYNPLTSSAAQLLARYQFLEAIRTIPSF
jgi:hypothetical protein